MIVQGVNVWSVLVGAVAAFVAGGVWYGAMFAKAWVAANGYSEDQVAEMGKKQGRNFAIFFVTDLLMAGVLALVALKMDITTVIGGLALGFLLWLGVALPIRASNHAANDRTIVAFVVDAGYELVVLLLVGAIVGAWH